MPSYEHQVSSRNQLSEKLLFYYDETYIVCEYDNTKKPNMPIPTFIYYIDPYLAIC